MSSPRTLAPALAIAALAAPAAQAQPADMQASITAAATTAPERQDLRSPDAREAAQNRRDAREPAQRTLPGSRSPHQPPKRATAAPASTGPEGDRHRPQRPHHRRTSPHSTADGAAGCSARVTTQRERGPDAGHTTGTPVAGLTSGRVAASARTRQASGPAGSPTSNARPQRGPGVRRRAIGPHRAPASVKDVMSRVVDPGGA
jgi:hypothetical protein